MFVVRVVYGQYIIDAQVGEIEPIYCVSFPVWRINCMNSVSYEYRKMLARRGMPYVPIGMPTVCWKTIPAKTTKMLSPRN